MTEETYNKYQEAHKIKEELNHTENYISMLDDDNLGIDLRTKDGKHYIGVYGGMAHTHLYDLTVKEFVIVKQMLSKALHKHKSKLDAQFTEL